MPRTRVETDPNPQPIEVIHNGVPRTLYTRWDTSEEVHYVACDLCSTEVKLTRLANPGNFTRHRNSAVCVRTAERAARQSYVESNATPHAPTYNALDSMVSMYRLDSVAYSYQIPSASSSTTSLGSLDIGNISLASPIEPPSTSTSRFSLSQAPSTDPVERPIKLDCPHYLADWTAGSVWDTYPYTEHDNDTPAIKWIPRSFEVMDGVPRLRLAHENCGGRSSSPFSPEPCDACRSIPHLQEYKRFLQQASTAAPTNRPLDRLSPRQLRGALHAAKQRNRRLTTQVYNLKHQHFRLRQKLDDEKRVRVMLSMHDVPGLRRLMAVARRHGSSARAILNLITRAANGLYHARGFSNADIDLSFLAKALGGPRLLYTMQKAMGLASATTLRRRRVVPKLVASIAEPVAAEIDHNIDAFFSPENKPAPASNLMGHVLCIDGVALDDRGCYDRDRNCVIGCSRETSKEVDLVVHGFQTLEKLNEELHNGNLRLASEATVVGVAPYVRSDHYTPVIIAVSPSDKTEKAEDLAKWIETTTGRYKVHKCGECVHGPIWAIASDGDSTYRAAKFRICFVIVVDRQTELGKILHDIPGLNLYTSKDGAVGTFDPKHVIKRFPTSLRSEQGFLVLTHNITRPKILSQLVALGETPKDAELLLDPADRQNVPKAVRLSERLSELVDRPLPSNASPSSQSDQHSLAFTAEIFTFFVKPFTTVTMSLSEQIESLSAYAHLTAWMAIQNNLTFINGALYHDSQCIVKNIIFLVARIQLIDPNANFYIILEGTDRLEIVFGDCRTLDSANRNFDILQLLEKLSMSMSVNMTYERNPEFDRGHRRLSLSGCQGVDHVNPRSWIGNVRVGDVKIRESWLTGRETALRVIRRYCALFDIAFDIDFDALWKKPGHDLLRPCGRYIGVQDVHEPEEREPSFSIATNAPAAPAPVAAADLLPNTLPVARNIEVEILSQSAEQEHDELEDSADNGSGEFEGHFERELEEEDEREAEEEEREKAAGNPSIDSDAAQGPVRSSATTRRLIEKNGRWFDIGSAVRKYVCINKSGKIQLRPLRVQNLHLEDLRRRDTDAIDLANLDDANLMKTNDIAGCLVCTPTGVCLAAVQVQGFKKPGETRLQSSIAMDELEDVSKHITAVCQIMQFKQSADRKSWDWTGEFLALKPSSSAVVRDTYIFEVPGVLLCPLAPETAEIRGASDPAGRALRRLTWRLSHTSLQNDMQTAWALVGETNDNNLVSGVLSLPRFDFADFELPYWDVDDNPVFVVADAPSHVINRPDALAPSSKVACRICGHHCKINEMRAHVARHILTAVREVPDAHNDKIGFAPCGFCGGNECVTQLIEEGKRKKRLKIFSTCAYRHDALHLDKAAAGQIAGCTNIPIFCLFDGCRSRLSRIPASIWKYNALSHIVTEHAEDGKLPAIPPQMMISMHIRQAEERAMGVPAKDTERFRETHSWPQSDAILPPSSPIAAPSSPVGDNDGSPPPSPTLSISSASSRKHARERGETVTQHDVPSKKRNAR